MNIPLTKLRGNAARCTLATLVFMVLAMMGSVAQAQSHGVQGLKNCPTAVRDCLSNDDCSDDLFCTEDICNTTIASDTINCTITYGNIDGFGDTQTITSGVDNLTTANGPKVLQLTVIDAGSSNCVNVAGVFAPPCDVPAGTSVIFESSYTLQPGDTAGQGALPDTADFDYFDNCDVQPAGCTTLPLKVQPGAATSVVPACEYPPVVCDDPQDFCSDPICTEQAQGCTTQPANVGNTCGPLDTCNELVCSANGTCGDPSPINNGGQCGPGDICIDEICQAGSCNPVPADEGQQCGPGDICIDEICQSGSCNPVPADEGQECGPGDICIDEICQGGSCNPVPADEGQQCGPGDVCNDEVCETGQCVTNPANEGVQCGPGDDCNEEVCETGQCVTNPANEGVVCGPGDECFEELCTSGNCAISNLPQGTDCTDTDGTACTEPACDGSGVCDQEDFEVTCEDETCEECNPADGNCEPIPQGEAPDECFPEGCLTRTRGYWINHSWQADAVADDAGGLETCGGDITGYCSGKSGQQYRGLAGNLKAQCVAATLNFASSAYFEGECSGQLADASRVCDGGDYDGQSCGFEDEGFCGEGISCSAQYTGEEILGMCCGNDTEVQSVCEGGDQASLSTCVDLISSFNESQDVDLEQDLCDDILPSQKAATGKCQSTKLTCLE